MDRLVDRLPGRRVEGAADPARSGRRSAGNRPRVTFRTGQPTDPHVGAARTRQGHRVGYRSDGAVGRSAPGSALRRRGPDPSEGSRACGRGLSRRPQCTNAPTRPGDDGDLRRRTIATLAELARLVQSADVVLLPYDSTEQVTSGVLIEAVAAGKPVVATQFPHASELLGRRRRHCSCRTGIRWRSPPRCARSSPGSDLARVDGECRGCRCIRRCVWSAVADQYRELARLLISERVAA